MAHIHPVIDSDKHFVIDPVTRQAFNSSSIIRLMQNDHNAERFTFEIPRYIDGHDMSLCNRVEIHYLNTDGAFVNDGVYEVDDLQVSAESDEVVTCSWLISQNVTKYTGGISFVIRYACVVDGITEYQWHTDVHDRVMVYETINNSEVVVTEYADILEQWRENLFNNAESEVLCVTVQSSNDGYIADKTVSEIYEAYLAGKSVVCHVRDLDGNFATNLVVCTSDLAGFSASVGDVVITLMLTENGVQMEFTDILTENELPDDVGGGILVTGAKVGQTIKVAEVDGNGVPTAWEATDFPDSGGNVDYVLPVGGDKLGGVKNGGNVVINEDGTMTAPTSSETGGLNVAGTPMPGYVVGLTDDLTPTWMSKEGEVQYAESENLATAENTAYDGRIDHSINALGSPIAGEILDVGTAKGCKHAKIEIPTGQYIIGVRYKVMGWQRNYVGNVVFTDENDNILWARNCTAAGTETDDGWCLPANTTFSGVGEGVTITIDATGVLYDISGLAGAKYLYFTTVRYDSVAATDIGVYLNEIPGGERKYDAWFVLGDSLSAGNRDHAETFYYEFIQNHLGKTIDLRVLAVGSKNSVSVVSEQIPQIVEVAGKRNLITCMIGTNDTFETGDQFKTNIENIISTAQTNFPNSTLVMITNPPRFDSEDYSAKMLTNADTIKAVCLEKNVKCIDFHHECGFAETNLAYFFCGDNLHLTVEGQRILATLLEPFVHSFFTI